MEETNTAYELRWHPFELNPNMSVEGENLRIHGAKKHGGNDLEVQASRDRMTTAGSEVGVQFNFKNDNHVHNTFNLH